MRSARCIRLTMVLHDTLSLNVDEVFLHSLIFLPVISRNTRLTLETAPSIAGVVTASASFYCFRDSLQPCSPSVWAKSIYGTFHQMGKTLLVRGYAGFLAHGTGKWNLSGEFRSCRYCAHYREVFRDIENLSFASAPS